MQKQTQHNIAEHCAAFFARTLYTPYTDYIHNKTTIHAKRSDSMQYTPCSDYIHNKQRLCNCPVLLPCTSPLGNVIMPRALCVSLISSRDPIGCRTRFPSDRTSAEKFSADTRLANAVT